MSWPRPHRISRTPCAARDRSAARSWTAPRSVPGAARPSPPRAAPTRYSGKHHHHGINVQALTDEHGEPAFPGQARPGSTPGLPAARADGIITTVTETDVETSADPGYLGAGGTIRTPVRRPKGKGHNGREKRGNHAHARLRAPVERAFATLKRRRILDLVRISPNRITPLLHAILTVTQNDLHSQGRRSEMLISQESGQRAGPLVQLPVVAPGQAEEVGDGAGRDLVREVRHHVGALGVRELLQCVFNQGVDDVVKFPDSAGGHRLDGAAGAAVPVAVEHDEPPAHGLDQVSAFLVHVSREEVEVGGFQGFRGQPRVRE
jgi:hypothetical protein